MKTPYYNAKVGLFILIGLIIFIGGILVIGSMRKVFIQKIEASAIFEDVSGLTKGNNIWFSGVKVGVVEDLDFLPNKGVRVTFNIEEKSKKFIYKDAIVKVSTDGLIGSPIVVITGGDISAGEVQEGHVFAVSKEDSQQDMIKTLQENNKNILAITADLKKVIGGIANGEGSIGKLIADDQLYTQVEGIMANLQNSTRSIQGFSNDLSVVSRKLKDPNALPNQLLSDTTIMPKLNYSMSNLAQSTDDLKAGTASVKKSAEQAGLIVQDAQAIMTNIATDTTSPVGVLLNDRSSANKVQGTLENLESSSEKLDENLKALQYNFLFRRYFRKKEKGKL